MLKDLFRLVSILLSQFHFSLPFFAAVCMVIVYMGFRATLNFRKFKVALNPFRRIVLNFAKKLHLIMLITIP